MKTITLILGCAVVSAFALGAGCGGRVVIDENERGSGQGGSSTSGNSGNSGNTTGTSGQGSTGNGGPGSSGSGGFDAKTACGQVCGAIEKGGCPQPNCVEDCVNEHATAGACVGDLEALIACYQAHLEALVNCGTPIACEKNQDIYNSCKNGGDDCSDQSCVQDDAGNCSCLVECSGKKLQSECSLSPNGIFCTCSFDGMPIGKCSGMDATCDVFQGCCGEIFGQNGG